jgi:hypothetical protein
VEKYVKALLKERDALQAQKKSITEVARDHALNERYASTLWPPCTTRSLRLCSEGIGEQFRSASADDATAVTQAILAWQQSLWRFATVGHIGKKDGPKGWQEPVSPIASSREMKLKLSAPKDGGDVTLYLAASDAGDGNEHDFALWENARLVAPGRADLPLRDVRAVLQQLAKRRASVIASASKCLAAVAEADAGKDRTDVAKLAAKHDVEPDVLAGWLDYLGVGSSGEVKLGPLIVNKMEGTPTITSSKAGPVKTHSACSQTRQTAQCAFPA